MINQKSLRTADKRRIPVENFIWSRELLEVTPGELKDNISTAKRARGAFEFLLEKFEDEAKRILKADLPSGMTKELDLSDLWWISKEPESFLLNPAQENAAAVLMRAFRLRDLRNQLSDLRQSGQTKEVSATDLAEEIALETIQLSIAVIRGDFWTNIWPDAQDAKRGANVAKGSMKGAEGKKAKSERIRNECREIALRFKRPGSINAIAKWVRMQLLNAGNPKPPKERTIANYIR
jgi:hypothetical protein